MNERTEKLLNRLLMTRRHVANKRVAKRKAAAWFRQQQAFRAAVGVGRAEAEVPCQFNSPLKEYELLGVRFGKWEVGVARSIKKTWPDHKLRGRFKDQLVLVRDTEAIDSDWWTALYTKPILYMNQDFRWVTVP